MARLTPEELEQKIHAVLREQPARRAPISLEARVLGEIARRNALPWWHKSYAFWPTPVRAFFVAVTLITAVACVLAGVFGFSEVGTAITASIVQPVRELLVSLHQAGTTLSSLLQRLLPSVESTWIYAVLAVVGAAYATLVGLGATAYRLLWSRN